MSLAAGTRLGPYEIEALLGAGGMGEVYRARDTRLDRAVAVKVISPQLTPGASLVARFALEARAVAALSHPNVLGIFDVGEEGGLAYAVTEFLEGETLRARLASGALPFGAAADLALQMVRGLAAAHDKSIVHRDLKPENLFVTREGRLKILDFGLARQAVAPDGHTRLASAGQTAPGVVVGTVGYMAPEQARGLFVDHRADIFAAGAVLYEMLSGRPAFRRETAADTLAAIVRDDPPDLLHLEPGVPRAAAAIVLRCLQKSPADRFQSAGELAAALENVSGGGNRPAGAAPGVAQEKGIVVLPFENVSADPENEYFADGLTEEIISDLSKIRGLRVISRTSAMQLKGRKGNLPDLVRELNVRYVLEGSVRRAGPRLRITAQLIDPASDAHLWSEKYNGTIEDVFDIQEQVARSIAAELRVKLTAEESEEIARRPIDDAHVFEPYLRARAGLLKFSEEGLARALLEIDRGLAIAPDSAPLLALKAEAAWQSFNLGLTSDRAQLDEVRAIVRRLDVIAPGSRHPDRLLGLVAAHSAQPLEAARRLRRALAADPGDTMAAGMLAWAAAIVGRTEVARAVITRAIEVDPLEPITSGMGAWVEMMDGRFAEALPLARRSYDLMPNHPNMAVMVAQCLAGQGRVAEALDVADSIVRDCPDHQWTWFSRILAWGLRGEGELIAASITPERRAWCSADGQYSGMVADAFALADRPDEAFEWLEILLATGACPYPFLDRYDPFLAKIRSDARWDPLIVRVRRAWEQAVL